MIVDVQKAFLEKDYPGLKRNNLDAEKTCGLILNKWRELKFPVIHVRHSSVNPDSKLHKSKPGFSFNDYVLPFGDLREPASSSKRGTDLKSILDKSKTEVLIIVGMTTNHCISTTVRMSGNLGYETYLISDSTAAYNTMGLDGQMIDCETIYKTSLASLNEEFTTIISSEELLYLLG